MKAWVRRSVSPRLGRAGSGAVRIVSRTAAVIMSAQGLAVTLLAGCSLLAIGPWLRSSISRDFRGIHLPWTDAFTGRFLPEYVVEVPRPWRWDSLATPLLAIAAIGMLVIIRRPQSTCRMFGLLLALAIPAVAASLWNHPALIEFFEGETRERSMLRIVYRQQDEDTMTNRAPDRLMVPGEKRATRDYIEPPPHPLVAPLRYIICGPWLIVAALAGTAITCTGSWPRRCAYAGAWAGAGILLGAMVTAPRLVAEYHWAVSEAAENRNQFAAAEQSLQEALAAMPRLADTARYWLAKGRLGYRQRYLGPYVSYFLAHQYLHSDDLTQARAEIEHSMRTTGGTTAQRNLLAEIFGHTATRYATNGKHGAAEVAWHQAADVAPWKPAYWIGETVTILAAEPRRAAEVMRELTPRLEQVGECFVSSDLASLVGDAFFADGEFHAARDLYSESMALFHLPKYVNLPAQEGKLGM